MRKKSKKLCTLLSAPTGSTQGASFFRIEPDQAIAILKLLHTEEATQEVTDQPSMIDQQSIAAAEQLRARRPNLNFEEMGIPMGATLQSVHSDTTVTVVAPKKVRLGDEEISLTAATRQVLGLDYSVQPGPHWTYEGKSIRDLYEETYGDCGGHVFSDSRLS